MLKQFLKINKYPTNLNLWGTAWSRSWCILTGPSKIVRLLPSPAPQHRSGLFMIDGYCPMLSKSADKMVRINQF